jgi:hypothetical protein
VTFPDSFGQQDRDQPAVWGSPSPDANPAYPPQPAYPRQPGYPQPPSHTPQQVQAAQSPAPRPRGRLVLAIVLLAIGVAGAGGGATVLGLEVTRHATTAEAAAAGQQEVATLWERLPAGQIFPRQVPYLGAAGSTGKAVLVGIAPASSCTTAVDPDLVAPLSSTGCTTMLRATYIDPTGTVIATVGLAAMGTAQAASGAAAAIGGNTTSGLRALSFPGTVSSNFTPGARVQFGVGAHGPYLTMYTAGYVDGRSTPGDSGDEVNPPLDLGISLERALDQLFNTPSKPCENRFIAC